MMNQEHVRLHFLSTAIGLTHYGASATNMRIMSFDDTHLTHALAAIKKSERIGIALPKEPNLDSIASAEVMVRALTTLGKQVGFITARPNEARSPMPHSALFASIAQWPTLAKELILLVDESSAPVSQIRYHKESQHLRIILTPQSRAVIQESVSFSEGAITCDTALFLGIPSLESMKDTLSAPIEFFLKLRRSILILPQRTQNTQTITS